MKIVVASTAKPKLLAVQTAFSILKGKETQILGYKAPSSVNEQPVGREEIELGCNNRLIEAMKAHKGDIFVSMENGIISEKSEWRDLAYIKMYFPKTRQEFSGYTDHVVFPTNCVDEARRRGFDKHTVGSVMAEMCPGIDKQDPQLSLTGKSRVLFLSETIEKLVQQANQLHLFHRMR